MLSIVGKLSLSSTVTNMNQCPPVDSTYSEKEVAESSSRDCKGRAWAAETELANEKNKNAQLTEDLNDLKSRVDQLTSELGKSDSGAEEARRTSKDRLAVMQREHERVIAKLNEDNETNLFEARQGRERALEEKRAVEGKMRETEDEIQRLRTELHGTKLRMRFGESTAPIAEAGGIGQPSPMFSDDLGPATPLVLDSLETTKMSALNTDSSNFGNNTPDTRSSAVGAESTNGGDGGADSNNNKDGEIAMLRGIIGEMRSEMEELTKANENNNNNNNSSNSNNNNNNNNNNNGASTMTMESATAGEEAEKKVRELEHKLSDTSTELKAIMADRNRLLDLSNKLRTDLQRASPEKKKYGSDESDRIDGKYSASNQKSGSRQLSDTIRSVEANTAARYESKISDIENALSALSTHNKKLRGEFGNWESMTAGEPSPMTTMHFPGASANNSRPSVAWQDEDQNEKLLEARRALMRAKEDLQIGDVWGEYDIKQMSSSGAAGGGFGGGNTYKSKSSTARPISTQTASSRTTDSQREAKERLMKTQRRRAELMNERRKVRNWNLKEGETP